MTRFAGEAISSTFAPISTDPPQYDELGNMTIRNRSKEKQNAYLQRAEVESAGFNARGTIAQAEARAAQIEANATVGAAQSQASGISGLAGGIAKGIGGMNIGGSSSSSYKPGTFFNPSNLNFTPAAGAWSSGS